MDIAVLNNSATPILIGQVVRQTGFVQPQQLPSVALASAASPTTAVVLGVSVSNIAIGSTGQIRISGDFSPLDTSSFALNAIVYLSNTPGAISPVPGSTSSIIGYATVISITGCVFITCTPANNNCGGGGGGGSQGATGPQGIQGATGVGSGGGGSGATGIQGQTGTQGVTGILGINGATGVQGVTGILGINGATGVQGVTGILGINGATGVQGITGTQGVTGILGINGATGVQGITGLQGVTGIQGLTGIAGITGLQTALGIYRYSAANGVPAGGTRFLFTFAGVAVSSIGDRMIRSATVRGISVLVSALDASRSYDINILSPSSGVPIIIATITLPVSTAGVQTSSLSVPIAAGAELGAQIVRASGVAAASTFSNINVSVLLE